MLAPELKKNFFLSSAVSFFLFSFFFTTAHAQDEAAFMVVKGRTVSNSNKSGLAGNLGVRTVDVNEEPMEGVDIEVKKNGVTVTKVISGKKGKYSFQIPVSTTDPTNDYTVYVSKEGTVPKILSINAYLSEEEFAQYHFAQYNFDIDVTMIQTNVKDIVLEKASGKIKWDDKKEHKFTLDQTYAKIVQKDEQKIAENPEQYFKDLAKKKAADEAKLKGDELSKLKAEEDAKKLANQKEKDEATRILQQNLEAMKQDIRRKRIADSLAEIEKQKAMEAANAKIEVEKIVEQNLVENQDKIVFDGSGAYSLNIALKSQKVYKEKLNKEKAKNISAKYETNNTLTSLLDMVDEHDKKMKKQ